MSGRTWFMMLLILGITWGGFVALLLYGAFNADRGD
jgi:hypothetical protein